MKLSNLKSIYLIHFSFEINQISNLIKKANKSILLNLFTLLYYKYSILLIQLKNLGFKRIKYLYNNKKKVNINCIIM